jgi:GH18 family chitinase
MINTFNKCKKLYLDKNISGEQRCHINFALAKIYEDLENFEKAFSISQRVTKLKKNYLNIILKMI